MSGPSHLGNLLVSLLSLRHHHPEAEVTVYAWAESFEIAQKICSDPDIEARCEMQVPRYRGKNAQFFNKIETVQAQSDTQLIYLDADTLVNRRFIDPDWLNFEFVATQFNDWTYDQRIVKKRISRLQNYPDQFSLRRVEQLLGSYAKNCPSVNGGVFYCRPDSQIVDDWRRLTDKVKESLFIADETVLHYVMADRARAKVQSPGWNVSPKFRPDDLLESEIRIWHFHGDSNVRQSKSPIGVSLWWPKWQQALDRNSGDVHSWKDQIGNRHLTLLEQTPPGCCFYCGRRDVHSSQCPRKHVT